jgi:hypothetical protein
MAGIGIAYPADASGGTPLYTATQGRTAFAATIGGATAARPLGGLSGVRPGTPANTVTATTTAWTATAFAGTIDLHALATNGPYLFSFPSGGSGTVVAQIGTPRQDIIWVRVDDSNTGDGSGARQVVVDYTAGTLTPPARAFVIAIINNTATGGGAPSVTWVAPYTVAAGGVLPIATQATLPTTGGYVGQYADVYADSTAGNNGLYRWLGSAPWVPVTGVAPIVVTPITGYTITTGNDAFLQSSRLTLTVDILKNTGTYTSNTVIATLPVGARPTLTINAPCAFGNVTNGWVQIDTAGNIRIFFIGAAANEVFANVSFRTV